MGLNNVLESWAKSPLYQKWLIVYFALRAYAWEVLEPFFMQGFEDFTLHIVDKFFWVVFEADRLSSTLLVAIVYFAEHAITKLPVNFEEPLQIFFFIYGLVVLRHLFDHTPKKNESLLLFY